MIILFLAPLTSTRKGRRKFKSLSQEDNTKEDGKQDL